MENGELVIDFAVTLWYDEEHEKMYQINEGGAQ